MTGLFALFWMTDLIDTMIDFENSRMKDRDGSSAVACGVLAHAMIPAHVALIDELGLLGVVAWSIRLHLIILSSDLDIS